MNTTVNVTAEHIAKGEAQECGRCPVALAMLEVLGDIDLAVYASRFRVFDNLRIEAEIPFPAEATAFIVAFDNGEPVQPFSFTVDYPEATA